MNNQSGREITAIIPAHNASATLRACLEAIQASTLRPMSILVFDDASTDDTAEIATSCHARVLHNNDRPVGPGKGRNLAAQSCSTELIVFIDADVMVHAEAIEHLSREFGTLDVVAAFGSYDDRPAGSRVAGHYANLRHHYFHQKAPRESATFWAGLGMIRLDAFVECGGFAAVYQRPSIEDVELGTRLIESGGRIRLIQEAQATHLKDWRLLQLWRADIFSRAIPWAWQIMTNRGSAAQLNSSNDEKLLAVAAWLILLFLMSIALTPYGLAGASLAAAVYGYRNRCFYEILARRLRGARLMAGIGLHWLYHLYASGVFGVIYIYTKLTSRSVTARRDRETSAHKPI